MDLTSPSFIPESPVKRPEGFPFPNVWSRFSGLKPTADGKIPQFWIEDLGDEIFDHVLNVVCERFLKDAVLSKATKLYENPKAVQTVQFIWKAILSQHLSLGAFTTNSGEEKIFVGCNILMLEGGEDQLWSQAMAESAERWQRPKAVPVPRVWRRCAGRTPVDGELPHFTIQDVPDDMHEEVVAFMSRWFPRDEPMCHATQLWLDPTSLEELQGLWREMLRQKVTLVALMDGGNGRRIAGCNMLGVFYKADRHKPNPYKGRAMRIFLDAVNHHNTIVDPYDKFGVDEALVGLGLSIDPSLRGQGLGLELLRARFDLGRGVGLRLTYTVFTAIQSQTLGARVGMETQSEVRYETYTSPEGERVLSGISFPPSMKMQASLIN